MKKHLEREIIEANPILYRGVHLPPTRSLMYRGFECGDGWFALLKEASIKTERLLKKMPKKERRNNYAMHVISKHGCLRIYMSLINEHIEKLLSELVTTSLHTCEICGSEGSRNNDKTRCKEHHDEAYARKFTTRTNTP